MRESPFAELPQVVYACAGICIYLNISPSLHPHLCTRRNKVYLKTYRWMFVAAEVDHAANEFNNRVLRVDGEVIATVKCQGIHAL